MFIKMHPAIVTWWVSVVCDHLRDAFGLPHMVGDGVPKEQFTGAQNATYKHTCKIIKNV